MKLSLEKRQALEHRQALHERLPDENRAEAILRFAADHPESELHREIPWDDAKLAHEARLRICRRLDRDLVRVKVTWVAPVEPIVYKPVLVRQHRRAQPTGEVTTIRPRIVAEPKRRVSLDDIEDAKEQLGRFCEKYKRLRSVTAFDKVFRAIDSVMADSSLSTYGMPHPEDRLSA